MWWVFGGRVRWVLKEREGWKGEVLEVGKGKKKAGNLMNGWKGGFRSLEFLGCSGITGGGLSLGDWKESNERTRYH